MVWGGDFTELNYNWFSHFRYCYQIVVSVLNKKENLSFTNYSEIL